MITGSGVAVSEKRSVSAFTAIDFTGSFDVVAVCQASAPSVEVSGDDNIVPVIRTEVDGTVLRIFTDQTFSTHTKLQVEIATADIENVHLKGSGNVVLSQVANERVELSLDGSGRIAATGKTQTATVSVSGSGQIAAGNLEAEDVDVTVKGSGRAEVRASSNLTAAVSGSGEIKYSGQPPNVSPSITGSGSISPQ